MYHPYSKGYSTLPQLEKLTEPPFHIDEYYVDYIREKERSLWRGNTQELIHDCSDEILETVESFIKKKADWTDPHFNLNCLCFEIQEDIAIHRIKDGKDWLAYTNICFPSSWLPEDKIGKPLAEIHAPIPGMKLDNSYKLAEASSQRGPFKRFVWSPIFENKFNFHPRLPKKEFDPDNPFVKVKVERQITWPFPELDCFLFILRQYIVDPVLPDLYEACAGMTEQQKKYKGVDDKLLEYLKEIK